MYSISPSGVNCRGSVLAFVAVALAAIALVTGATLWSLSAEAGRNSVARAIGARQVNLLAARNIVLQYAQDQLEGLSPSSPTAAVARISNGGWSVSLTNGSGNLALVGDRAASFGPNDGATMQPSFYAARSRTTYVRYTVTQAGNPTGGAALSISQTVSAAVVEVPATEFQFVVSDSAFQQSASTDIIISGRALFNYGVSTVSPAGLRFDGAATSFGLYFGTSNIPADGDATLRPVSLGSVSGFTRGIGAMSNLLASPSASVATRIDQQALSRPASSSIQISWPTAAASPTGLVPGISYQNVAGLAAGNYVVIDLATYVGFQNLWVDCVDATAKAQGVVVLGAASGLIANAQPLNIATNGKLTLLGPNYRPVITATSYGLQLGASRSSPTTSPAADVPWSGYVCLAVANPTVSSPCAWNGYRFNIRGTFAFPGGAINNSAVPISVTASSATALAVCSGTVIPDRLLFVEPR